MGPIILKQEYYSFVWSETTSRYLTFDKNKQAIFQFQSPSARWVLGDRRHNSSNLALHPACSDLPQTRGDLPLEKIEAVTVKRGSGRSRALPGCPWALTSLTIVAP